MFIDINKIGSDGVAFDLAPDLEGLLDATGEAIPVVNTRLAGRADREPDGVHLRGTLETTLSMSCSRCLRQYETSVSVAFALQVVTEEPDPVGDDLEIGGDDALLLLAEGGIVRLDEVAREQAYLGLPLKPVCATSCRGLCPRCGENRNEVECGCGDEEIDPRLAPLMEIKRQRPGP